MNAWFEYESDGDCRMFFFKSGGESRAIKIVLFTELPGQNMYAITLGELQNDASVDVQSANHEGDTIGVLSTVAKIIAFFLSDHPDADVLIEGSTPARNRLYQMAITREQNDLGRYFDIYGVDGFDQELFTAGRIYNAFIVSVKSDF